MRRRARWWLYGGLLAAVGAVGGGYWYWRDDALTHAHIRHLHLIDIERGGPKEVVVVYSNDEEVRPRRSTVEAFRANGERLWRTDLDDLVMSSIVGRRMTGDDGRAIILPYLDREGGAGDSFGGLLALRARDGEILWRTAPLRGTRWMMFGRLIVHGGSAIVMTNPYFGGGEDCQEVIAWSTRDGRERWRVRLSGWDDWSSSTLVGDTLGFARTRPEKIALIDLVHGHVREVDGVGSMLYPVEGALLTLDAERRLVEIDPTTGEITARREGPGATHSQLFSLAGDLTIRLSYTEAIASRRDGTVAWRTAPADGFEYVWSVRHLYDPAADVHTIAPSRYVPVALWHRERELQRLAILDLSEGLLTWQSRDLATDNSHEADPNCFFAVGSRHFVQLGAEPAAFLIVIDGARGVVTHAFRLDGDERHYISFALDSAHQPWLVDGDLVWGFEQQAGDRWAIDLGRRDGVFEHAGGVRIASDLDALRHVIGPLPVARGIGP